MEEPLISVLMGIYNCADTLEEAVQCIIDQTYANWELILCDDCSKDQTLEVAKMLAQKDNRIIVIKNEKNLTLAPTLNHCLQIAKGKYIARMDGDDLCAKDRFEKELRFLETHSEYSLVSCQMNLFDSDGVYRTIVHSSNPQKGDWVKKSQFCHAGCMMRTEVLRELNGYSELSTRNRVEDYDLWVRMYSRGYRGYNLQEALYDMRDDRKALHRRTWKNRINEVRVKFNACKSLKLPITCYLWVIIPIIKGMMPSKIYRMMHKSGSYGRRAG